MRASFPEYKLWQNAMRPEDIAHHDAQAAATAADGDIDYFEAKVARHLGSRLGVVRNNFAEEEYKFWAEYKKYQPEYLRLSGALNMRGVAGSPVAVPPRAPLARVMALALVAVLSAAVIGLLGLLLSMRGMEPWPASIVACAAGAALLALAYATGVLLRQSQRALVRNACLVVSAVTAVVLLAALGSMPTPQLGSAERLWIGGAIVLCCLGIAVCAYYSHDPDPEATRLEREFLAAHSRMTEVVAKRHENRVFHLNVARRHLELAREMVAAYRQVFGQSAPDGSVVPKRFQQAPQLVEIDEAWFQLHEENTL